MKCIQKWSFKELKNSDKWIFEVNKIYAYNCQSKTCESPCLQRDCQVTRAQSMLFYYHTSD